MAEAIAIGASVIALAQAAVMVRDLLGFVSWAANASQEAQRFEHELAQLGGIILEIEKFARPPKASHLTHDNDKILDIIENEVSSFKNVAYDLQKFLGLSNKRRGIPLQRLVTYIQRAICRRNAEHLLSRLADRRHNLQLALHLLVG